MSQTELRILGWQAEGLRCPDHELSFQLDDQGSVHPITLIQMPNGTGKTTTLLLLRAALSGEADRGGWAPARVRGFRKSTATTKGSFRLALYCSAGRVTISMEFDFIQNIVKYKTTHGSGIQDGFRPPRDIKKFLRPELVECFVFDGELAHRLLDHEHTNAETVMEHLFQLSVFGHAVEAVRDYWERATARNSAKEERGYTRRKNKVDAIKSRLRLLRSEQSTKLRALATVEDELREMHSKFAERLAHQRQLSELLRTAEVEFTTANGQVAESVRSVISAMHDPHALSATFAAEMVALKKHLDRVKLPEHSAREFFIELAEEVNCVCGRPHTDETRDAVRTQSAKYLGTDAVALLNAMKSDIADQIGDDTGAHARELHARVGELEDRVRASVERKTECDEIRARGVSNDPVLHNADDKIKEKEDRRDTLKAELARYVDTTDSANDDETYGIKVLERRLKNAETKLAEIAGTMALKAKRDVLVSIFNAAHLAARTGIGQEITADTNARIQSIMPNNAIRVHEVRKCLMLDGQDGGSVGETLSVAYAFLATLFNRSEHVLPFVVDSPANPIDLRVRERVAELIPQLGSQFIAFTISSERQQFLIPLEGKAKRPIQYLTLFRRGAAPLDGAETTATAETSDAYCVSGRDFFHGFHLDTEVNSGV
jgi:DNA sulfur modification protein DndD